MGTLADYGQTDTVCVPPAIRSMDFSPSYLRVNRDVGMRFLAPAGSEPAYCGFQ